MSRGVLLLVAALLLGGAAIVMLTDGGESEGPSHATSPARAHGNAQPKSAEPLTAGPGTSSSSRSEPMAPAAAEPAARLLAATERLGALRRILAQGRLQEDGESRDERKRLIAWLRQEAQSSEGASTLLALLAREADAQTAVRLGRALRNARFDGMAADLSRRATEARGALERRGAVIALEHRPPEQWFDAVATAYRSDDDGAVREEAANVLGRALVDRMQRSHHDRIRATLATGLGSGGAEQRLRTLTALMADRTPPAELRARVQDLRDDDDPRVGREARALLRVWETRTR